MSLHHHIDKFCRIVVNSRTQAHFGRIREVYDNVVIFESTNGNKHKGIGCPKKVSLKNPAVAEFIEAERLTVNHNRILFTQRS